MSGHTRWDGVPPLPDRAALEIQLAYVDGYILALEDVFKDLAQIEFPPTDEQLTEAQELRRTFLLRRYRRDVRRTLSISLEAARRTRGGFQADYEGRGHGDTGEREPEALGDVQQPGPGQHG